MKVPVNLTIDVDPNYWIGEYGCAREVVKSDVEAYVFYLVREFMVNEAQNAREVERH